MSKQKTKETNNTCEELDLANTPTSLLKYWGIPIALILLGSLGDSIDLFPFIYSELLWIVGIVWLGYKCMRNGLRCKRTHCILIGVTYPIFTLVAIGLTLDLILFITWNQFWNIFMIVTVLTFVPEFIGRKYWTT